VPSLTASGSFLQRATAFYTVYLIACVEGYEFVFPPRVDECFDRVGHAGKRLTYWKNNVLPVETGSAQSALLAEIYHDHPELRRADSVQAKTAAGRVKGKKGGGYKKEP
jgi:hypothetical protein